MDIKFRNGEFMNINALRSLARIDEVLSFSKAASIENMTLSALSMQMKALEQELDVHLFDRSFRPPKLTPLGKTVASHARRVLKAKQDLLEACSGAGALTGQFHLGFIQSTSVRIMPTFLRLARRRYPRAAFQLSSNLSEDLTEQVRLGALDAAVVTRVAMLRNDLHAAALRTEKLAFATPAAFANVPLEEIPAKLPFVHFRPTSGIGQLIERILSERSPKPAEIIVLDSLEACMACVKEGLGYTLLPLPDIQRCADARAHFHCDDAQELTRDIVLVVRRDNAETDWSRALQDLLRESFESAAQKDQA